MEVDISGSNLDDMEFGKERNSRCFEGISSSESRLVDKTKFLVALWVSINPSFKGYSIDQIVYQWKELALS